MQQKPNVKVVSYAIENTGDPFLFKLNPSDLAQAENSDAEKAQQVAVDGEGNVNISFGDEPTLIIGSTPERSFEDGFWINDKDSVTFAPIFDQHQPAPKGFFGIRVLPGVTKFHVVTIVQEPVRASDDELTEEEINALDDAFDGIEQDEQAGELYYEQLSDAEAQAMDAEFSPASASTPMPAIEPEFYPQDNSVRPLMDLVDLIITQEQEALSAQGAQGSAKPSIHDSHFLLSLPGMAFVTGRHEYARTMLAEIARQIEVTLIQEKSGLASAQRGRTTVKAFETELWFATIVDSFIRHSGDYDFVKSKLWRTLKAITQTVMAENAYQLSVGDDGLLALSIGEKQHIRAHLNALWYNHLRVMEGFSRVFGEKSEQVSAYRDAAASMKKSFAVRAWDKELHGVVDFDGDTVLSETRPEHVFVLSLPHSLLTQARERELLARIWKDLYTPYGLKSAGMFRARSLDSVQRTSRASAGADRFGFLDDQSWASFVGPFISSYIKIQRHSAKSREFAKRNLLAPLVQNVNMLSLEQFARGGSHIAASSGFGAGSSQDESRQLIWNIAELVRSYVEDIGRPTPSERI